MPHQPKSGRAILLNARDNVATALEDLPQGSVVALPEPGRSITLAEDIRFGHKFAVTDLAQGELVLKYGVPIGKMTRAVQAGEHVHVHNLVTLQRKEEGA